VDAYAALGRLMCSYFQWGDEACAGLSQASRVVQDHDERSGTCGCETDDRLEEI
jgi:hypothetical protein